MPAIQGQSQFLAFAPGGPQLLGLGLLQEMGSEGGQFMLQWSPPGVESVADVIVQKAAQRRHHFRRLRQADHLRPGVRDQPGQHGETPSPLKIQKLARHGVRDQPGQHGKTLSLLKIQNWLGVVAHTCSPSYSGGWERRIV
ncbi:hypothetical protein AAY473_020738 [Plecturocebus cupreus]